MVKRKFLSEPTTLNMEDNIDDLTFADSPVAARRSVKQGRRAATAEDEDQDDFSGSPLKNRPKTGDILLLDEGPRRPRASAPARRSGQGWGEETRAKTARSIRPMTAASVRAGDESDDEPMIPDLEEVEQDLLVMVLVVDMLILLLMWVVVITLYMHMVEVVEQQEHLEVLVVLEGLS